MTIPSKVNLKFLQVLYAFILSVRCLILLHVKASPQVLVLYHSSFINGFLLNDHFVGIGKLELERAVRNTAAQFPMKPLWLATMSFIGKKLGLSPYS